MKNIKSDKIYVLSIQGTEIVNDGSGQYFDRSYIKVVDLKTGEKLDWKLGVFTQAEGQYHEKEEVERLKRLGFQVHRVCGTDFECNEDAYNLASRHCIDWRNYADDEEPYFDGYVFIGEINKEVAEKLSNEYAKTHCVY